MPDPNSTSGLAQYFSLNPNIKILDQNNETSVFHQINMIKIQIIKENESHQIHNVTIEQHMV